MQLTDQLLSVARAYSEARRLSLARTSTLVFNEGKKLGAIASGSADLATGRFERAMQWFSDHWPSAASWPDGVLRPPSCQAEAYSDANVFRAAHPSTPLWKALAITWFKNRRNARAVEPPRIASVPPVGKTLAKIAKIKPSAITELENLPRSLLPPERKGQSVADQAKHDKRPALRGWKPGNHLRRCGACGTPYVGNPRSEECADCAYRAEEVAKAS